MWEMVGIPSLVGCWCILFDWFWRIRFFVDRMLRSLERREECSFAEEAFFRCCCWRFPFGSLMCGCCHFSKDGTIILSTAAHCYRKQVERVWYRQMRVYWWKIRIGVGVRWVGGDKEWKEWRMLRYWGLSCWISKLKLGGKARQSESGYHAGVLDPFG